jgi:hypothetical protein
VESGVPHGVKSQKECWKREEYLPLFSKKKYISALLVRFTMVLRPGSLCLFGRSVCFNGIPTTSTYHPDEALLRGISLHLRGLSYSQDSFFGPPYLAQPA